MQIISSIEQLHNSTKTLSLAAGFFDGVHRGHQAVLQATVASAERHRSEAWVFTFEQHPLALLNPAQQPPLLSPPPLRLELLAGTGIAGCLLLPFTDKFAATPPEEFISWLCGPQKSIVSIHSGTNWHFGLHGRGDTMLLTRLGRQYGFEAAPLPPLNYRNAPISSTRIRNTLQQGNVSEAAIMLGRPYLIRDTVVPGRGVGRTLNIATANLQPANALLPAVGVYAVIATFNSTPRPAVASIGWRPTFADARPATPVLEVHILDCNENLYGATLDISFIARLRDEIKFPDTNALQQQVARDIREARSILASPISTKLPDR